MDKGPRYIRDVLRILRDIGCEVDIEQNKHVKVRVSAAGGRFTWTVPVSPGDVRSIHNALAQLRRELKKIGIEPPQVGLRGADTSPPEFDELWLVLDAALADSDAGGE